MTILLRSICRNFFKNLVQTLTPKPTLKEIKVGVGFDSYSKYITTINGVVKVLKSDISTLNGVVHIIDSCIDTRSDFYTFDEMDEFDREYGVISKRSMKVSGEEKELNF